MKRLIQAKTVVVKVGSSTITNADGEIDTRYLLDLARQLSEVRQSGRNVVLVTSGAVRAGVTALRTHGTNAPAHLSVPEKQAAAAVGQGLLMHAYSRAFARRDQQVAQILLTREVLDGRRNFLNTRNTIRALFEMGIVPIVNENDTVAVDEIKFGDNDTLASMVAIVVDADLMILLSVVDGLYLGEISQGKALERVDRITREIEAAVRKDLSAGGTGGMYTKIQAARQAIGAGIPMVLAHGRATDVVLRIMRGEPMGTYFASTMERNKQTRLTSRKKWIAFGRRPRGEVVVNEGAMRSIVENGKSLLAVGIVGVSGAFDVGDMVSLREERVGEFARGLVNYRSQDINKVMGLRSNQIEKALGFRDFDEVVHRNNLVRTRGLDLVESAGDACGG